MRGAIVRAITFSQPWASLVSVGAKRCETRSWRTDYTGPLAIHAAKTFPPWARGLCYTEPFASALKATGVRVPDELPLGAVVAVARLTGCFLLTPGEWLDVSEGNELDFGDHTPGRIGWLLADVQPLCPPVPARGRPGLWDWEPPC